MEKYKLLINGQWVDPQGGEWFETENPFTGQPWALIPKCGKADVDAAVGAAKAAFHEKSPWRTMNASSRGALLRNSSLAAWVVVLLGAFVMNAGYSGWLLLKNRSAATFSTAALPPVAGTASKPVLRTDITLILSFDCTVASALPA